MDAWSKGVCAGSLTTADQGSPPPNKDPGVFESYGCNGCFPSGCFSCPVTREMAVW
jgi:hypothetical protein